MVLLATAWLAYALLLPLKPATNSILLRPGSSARHIARELKAAGVIREPYSFLALHYLRLKPLKAGEYAFDHPASAMEVYDRLAKGDIVVHMVSIPEGYNIFDVAQSMER